MVRANCSNVSNALVSFVFACCKCGDLSSSHCRSLLDDAFNLEKIGLAQLSAFDSPNWRNIRFKLRTSAAREKIPGMQRFLSPVCLLLLTSRCVGY